MKVFDVDAFATVMGGEYVLGAKDLHSKACYLIYGTLGPGEGERLVQPGRGYEEVLCAVDGPLILHGPGGAVTLEFGHAAHFAESDSFYISNPSEKALRYIAAGGPTRHNVPDLQSGM